ncbi:MAG: bifunctional oligoribonuclease/PAP phosphatase NrnA [Calditrichaeota bacterium]|nr:MAG: bifunctional oligoribonuclease/PAP phosphatase NrnA [Calditrichota bacterium]
MKLMKTTNKILFEQHQPPVKEISDIIERAAVILVVSHLEPDGDALGTQLAVGTYLESLGKRVVRVRDGVIPEKYSFLKGADNIPTFEELKPSDKIDTAIILECPNVNRVGSGKQLLTEDTIIINIDHHRDNDVYGAVNWINTGASSVGEMLFEYFEAVDYKIDFDTAEQLYTAILTDTGRFRYKSTTQRTLEIAGKLVGTGIDSQMICDTVYYNLRPSSMILTGKVLNGIEFYENNQICALTLTNKMLEEAKAERSESDGFVDFTLFNRGVTVGLFFKEVDESTTKVSLRSKNGINVSAIASQFGGGGHFNAAGCQLDLPLEKAREKMLQIVKEVLNG